MDDLHARDTIGACPEHTRCHAEGPPDPRLNVLITNGIERREVTMAAHRDHRIS
jgi:hypothetical protein